MVEWTGMLQWTGMLEWTGMLVYVIIIFSSFTVSAKNLLRIKMGRRMGVGSRPTSYLGRRVLRNI